MRVLYLCVLLKICDIVSLISVDNISVEFNATPLFEKVSYVVNKKERIALVGKNGAGKSTMLKILSGVKSPTSGVVSVARDVKIGYLPQVMKLADTTTVLEETSTAFEHIKNLKQEIDRLNREIAERTDYESESYLSLIEKYTRENDKFLMAGGDSYIADIEKTLMGLGFSRADLNRPTSEFSGGWRMRIELAKLLLSKPDVLLLDEPTNHLDIESIEWLESFLMSKANAVILVSHDRAFLNNVTNRTIEINCGKIYDYKVKYDDFVELRKERREQQLRAYENQQKQLEDTEAFIERFRYKATKAVQVQSRIKQLEKVERIEIDEDDTSVFNIKFSLSKRSGSYPVVCKDLRKDYGNHTVFSGATFTINRGDKVAFVGRNGEGKSTLIKCIMQEIDYQGVLEIGHNVEIGYFAQNQAQMLDDNITVFDTIDNVATGDIRTKMRDILAAFMFIGEEIEKPVKVLSGGERTRLAMVKLLLEPTNLLILDEPTNHLDMRSKDVLKKAIKEFDGTVIVVSHDRDFLDGLVTKVYEFANGKVIEHLGGVYDYLKKKKMESLNELQKSTTQKVQSQTTKNTVTDDKAEAKNSYEQQKELNKQIKKVERAIENSEKMIEKAERELSQIEELLSTPDGASDMSLHEKYVAKKKEIDSLVEEWETQTMMLEELTN